MTTPRFFFAFLLLGVSSLSADAARRPALKSPLQIYSSGAAQIALSARESRRIERFLSSVFPARSMMRLEHTRELPPFRRATYAVVDQDGSRFVIAGFTGQWSESVNVFAVYRMEAGGPNQVWRSKPWEANYDRLQIQTAQAGRRTVVLFEEGGYDGDFGLASVFTFQDGEHGIAVSDLTPSLPWLSARTHFPFRPLYGSNIALKTENKELVLTASDQLFQVGLVNATRLERTWKYIPKRNRFEHAREKRSRPSQLTQIGETHVGD